MPRGVPKDGRWRGSEALDEWVRRTQASAPLCACGCGARVTIQRHHRAKGIPRFVHGHHARVEHGRYAGVDKWVADNQGRHACACGCGGTITVTAQHHAVGIPRYLPAHHAPPLLGHGPDHPAFIHDRSLVKARNGQGFTPWVMQLIHERDGGRCVRCGESDDLEHDHVIPIGEGGTGEAANGQLLCRRCHRLKTDADLARGRLYAVAHQLLQTLRWVLAALRAHVAIHHPKEVLHGGHR